MNRGAERTTSSLKEIGMKVTDIMLQRRIAAINRLLGVAEFSLTNGKLNAGNYHLDNVGKGWVLHRIAANGSVDHMLGGASTTRSELYDQVNAFLAGMAAADARTAQGATA